MLSKRLSPSWIRGTGPACYSRQPASPAPRSPSSLIAHPAPRGHDSSARAKHSDRSITGTIPTSRSPRRHKTKRRVANVDCRQIRGLLPAYLDGELSAATRAEIEEHLADCPSCRSVANDYRRDMQVLSYQLGVAPWLPVKQRPWEATRAEGFWSWLRPIGHKAVAGTAMVALVALIVTGALALREMANGTNPNGNLQATQTVQAAAGSSATSSATSVATASTTVSSAQIDKAMEILTAHKLAWPVDKDIRAKGASIFHLSTLAADRTATLLTVVQPSNQPELPEIELKLPNGELLRAYATGVSADGTNRSTGFYLYPALDDNVTKVTLHLPSPAFEPAEDVPLSVDLSPLKQANLPEPLAIGEKQRQNDVNLKLVELTRGLAISALTWQATDIKPHQPANLVLMDAKAIAGGADIPIIRGVLSNGSNGTGMFWLLDLPKDQSFRLTFAGGRV